MLFSLLFYAEYLYRRRCQAASLDSSPPLDICDAGGDHSRWAVFARDLAQWPSGSADLLGADRARRRRRIHLFRRRGRREAARLFRHRHHGADAVHARPLISRRPAAPGRHAISSRCWRQNAKTSSWSQDGAEVRRPVREVEAGMLVRVRPGERIPVDGVVIEGESHADEAVITGESRLVTKRRRLCGDRRQHQYRRPAADPQQRGRNRDALGTDLPIGSGRAIPAQPNPAYRRPRGRYLRAPRSGPRRVDRDVLGAMAAVRSGAAHWARGAGCCLSLCRRSRRTTGDLARHWAAGAPRLPCPRPGALEALARTRLLAFDKTGTLTLGRARVVAIDSDGVGARRSAWRGLPGLERHSEHGSARAINAAAGARHRAGYCA